MLSSSSAACPLLPENYINPALAQAWAFLSEAANSPVTTQLTNPSDAVIASSSFWYFDGFTPPYTAGIRDT